MAGIDPWLVARRLHSLQDARPRFTPPLRGTVVYDAQADSFRFAISLPGITRQIAVPSELITTHPPAWYWRFAGECFVQSINQPDVQAWARQMPWYPRFIPVPGVSSDLIIVTTSN